MIVLGSKNDPGKRPTASESRDEPLIVLGIVLLILGGIALAYVYSLRPPEGLGDTFSALMSGRERYIKEPVYSILMSISGITTFAGAAMFLRGLFGRRQ